MQTHQYDIQRGLKYNVTLFAVNCGNQNGTATSPILIFPQGTCVYVFGPFEQKMHHLVAMFSYKGPCAHLLVHKLLRLGNCTFISL